MMSSCTPAEPQYLVGVDSSITFDRHSTNCITYLNDSVYVRFTPSFSKEIVEKGYSHLGVLEKTHPNLLTEQAAEQKDWLNEDTLTFRIPLRNQEEEEAYKTEYYLNHDIRVDYAFIGCTAPLA